MFIALYGPSSHQVFESLCQVPAVNNGNSAWLKYTNGMKRMKNIDPMEEVREWKRKLSEELEKADRKGKLKDKLHELEINALEFIRPRKIVRK